MQAITITRHAEIRAVLADPCFVVPAVSPAHASGGVEWLRAAVARFSSGDAHRRRRALVTTALAQVNLAELRAGAFRRTGEVLRVAGRQPVDLMALLARAVPVGLLADAIGMPAAPAGAVAAVALAYHPGPDADPVSDRALGRLVEADGGVADEVTAARIGLLVQACDATARLIGNASLAVLRDEPAAPGRRAATEALLAETLRHDPPVRATRRVAAAGALLRGRAVRAGTPVRLDLAAANRDPSAFGDPGRFDPGRADRAGHLTFGAGPHGCPGSAHALSLAAGIVDAVRDRVLVHQDVEYEPSANLRVPTSVMVRAR